MYLFMREMEALPLNKLKPCMTPFCADVAYSSLHLRQFCAPLCSLMRRIIVTSSPFLSSVSAAQKEQNSPCRRNRI